MVQQVRQFLSASRWRNPNGQWGQNPRSWGFSLLLLASYLVTFHSWLAMPEAMVSVTGWIVPMILSFLGYEAWRRGEFVNRLDAGCHFGVILDLWLEGVFVRLHEGFSFYACAFAFAVVIGGYRFCVIFRNRIRNAQAV